MPPKNGFEFAYSCPHCRKKLMYTVTPERVNMVPAVEVPLTYCTRCGRDITNSLSTALNAPLFLSVEALRYTGTPYGDRPVFQMFQERWRDMREVVERARYLDLRERHMLRDLFGFDTGAVLSYKALGDLYGLSASGAQKVVRGAFQEIAKHDRLALQRYLNPLYAEGIADAEEREDDKRYNLVENPMKILV